MTLFYDSLNFILNNFVAVTSLFINICFICNAIQEWRTKCKLKAVLSKNKKEVHILTSENLNQDSNVEISFEQACSLSYISELYRKAGKEIEIKSLSTHIESPELFSEICLGGPLDNKLTDGYMEKYFPQFETLVPEDKLLRYNWRHESKIVISIERGFCVRKSSREHLDFLINDETTDYFVIIKLDAEDLEEDRSVIMIYGYTRKGLLCGTKYLYNNYNELYKKYKKNHFFIIGRCSIPTLQIDIRKIYDLTPYMFGEGKVQ